MIIHDLEFFNSCSQESSKSDLAITGGASASTYVNTGANENNVYATAEAAAQGDYSSAAAGTSALINKQPSYTSGYGSGYAAGYGVSGYGPVAKSVSSGVSTI
jgi:hypothetical protein